MQQEKGLIYCLKDPFTEQIRYIGFTSQTPKYRMNGHRTVAKHQLNKTYHSANWFRKCLELGKEPIMEILEDNIDIEKWEERENYYIDKYNNLTNHLRGGHGVLTSKGIKNKSHSLKVVQFDLNSNYLNTYNSITEAEKILNLSRSSRISHVINKKANSAAGFLWCTEEDYLSGYIPIYIDKQICYNNRIQSKMIETELFCIFTGKSIGKFKSFNQAIEFLGIKPGNAKSKDLYVGKFWSTKKLPLIKIYAYYKDNIFQKYIYTKTQMSYCLGYKSRNANILSCKISQNEFIRNNNKLILVETNEDIVRSIVEKL